VSDRSLVVRHGSLSEVQDAVATTHRRVEAKVADLLAAADAEMAAWAAETASRTAETDYRRRVTDGVERLGQALEKIRAATAQVAENAHEAEVKNVALLD
jgi:hypothetical protein